MVFDYFALLSELQRHGVSCSETARRLGVHESAVRQWKAGLVEPRFPTALELIALYCRTIKPANSYILVSTNAYKITVTPTV